MPVIVSMPGNIGRWPTSAFDVLGDGNTCSFRYPLCCQRSGRLFLDGLPIASNQALTDHQTGISVGMASHVTLRAQDQRCAWCIAFCRLACLIASDKPMTASTIPARVPGIDSTGDDPCIPCLVSGKPEDASLHPERSFAIPAPTVLAPLRFEMAQMLEHKNGCLLC
jgi:hypothetical protein